MTCCSAYDIQPKSLPVASKKKTAAEPPPYDCKHDGCYNELEVEGGERCPPGRCKRDANKQKAAEHDAPECKNHPTPFGRPTKKAAKKTAKKTAKKAAKK